MAQLKDLIVNGNARIITDLNVNGYETVDETVKVGRDPTANLEVATKQYVDNHSGGGSWYGTTYTLPAAMWANNQQDASLTDMTSTCNVWVAPAHGSEEEYINCGVYASAQGADTLTFTCATTPLTAIDVSIIWIES